MAKGYIYMAKGYIYMAKGCIYMAKGFSRKTKLAKMKFLSKLAGFYNKKPLNTMPARIQAATSAPPTTTFPTVMTKLIF